MLPKLKFQWVLKTSFIYNAELWLKACSAVQSLYSDYCELRIKKMTQASSNENTKNNNKALAKLSPSKVVAEVELDEASQKINI